KRATTSQEIRVSLSQRRLSLVDGRRTVRTIPVAIGRSGSATPTGTFAVTDKLSGSSFGPYYGCCILALSGHQTHTPPGWQGGDLVESDLDDFASRTAVLAYGSNASPDSLRWKFPDQVAVMPLLRGTAPGMAVVYSALMALYGSIPATPQATPSTKAEVFVAL